MPSNACARLSVGWLFSARSRSAVLQQRRGQWLRQPEPLTACSPSTSHIDSRLPCELCTRKLDQVRLASSTLRISYFTTHTGLIRPGSTTVHSPEAVA